MAKWYKLDNAAKLFPSITNTKNTSVFRVSVLLNSEVDAEALQRAADTVLGRFPMMAVKLCRGLFWNYLDINRNKFRVSEEKQYPCNNIDPKTNNGYLIVVLYYKYRISVEVFHSITDGSGAAEFLKSLVYYYLKFLGNDFETEGKILVSGDGVHIRDIEDSFHNYYQEKSLSRRIRQEKAYQIRGESFDAFGNNVVHGVVSASHLHDIAKQKGVTITSYLAALLMYSIHQTKIIRDRDDAPVTVVVPVNFRKLFPSQTLRNFFGAITIGDKITSALTFDELVYSVHRSLKEKTNKERLNTIITEYVKLEKSSLIRFIPLFIKNIFIKLGYTMWGENKSTITLSNIGIILLPRKMHEFIDHFEAVLYPTKRIPVSCGICSFNDRLTITFTRTIVDAGILQYFFSFLSEKDRLDVEVYSNDWGKYNG
jgi:NRPS condensation-like uncharacterized protein